MKQFDFKQIDWSELRNQKRELLKSIKDIEDRQMDDDMGKQDREQINGLDGILHLIDSLQDYAVDELGMNANDVFDFEAEDIDNHPEPLYAISKELWICPHCDSDNVEIKHWIGANNRVIGTDTEDEEGWCKDCEQHGELFLASIKPNAEVIGFQVVDNKGLMHPKMFFGIYSLSQAKAIAEKGCDNPEQQWKVWAIWTGEVVNPTFMFKGNPRD